MQYTTNVCGVGYPAKNTLRLTSAPIHSTIDLRTLAHQVPRKGGLHDPLTVTLCDVPCHVVLGRFTAHLRRHLRRLRTGE